MWHISISEKLITAVSRLDLQIRDELTSRKAVKRKALWGSESLAGAQLQVHLWHNRGSAGLARKWQWWGRVVPLSVMWKKNYPSISGPLCDLLLWRGHWKTGNLFFLWPDFTYIKILLFYFVFPTMDPTEATQICYECSFYSFQYVW